MEDQVRTPDQLSRRTLLKRAAVVGMTLPAISGLLAACGGEDEDEPAASDVTTPEASTSDATTPEASTSDAETPEGEEEDDTGSLDDSEERVLTVAWWEDFVELDPTQMRDSLATEIAYKIFSNLVRVQSGTFDEVVGDAATEWEISEDGKTYTFTLREGILWHKEEYGELTSRDVAFSLMRHFLDDPVSRFQEEASPISDVEAIDDYTVAVNMKQPYPGFLLEFAAYRPGFIVCEQALEDLGGTWSDEVADVVGSGAFQLDSRIPEERVDLVRFDGYYAETGPFSGISYRLIAEAATVESALERGEIDIAYVLEPEVQKRMIEHPDLKSKEIPAPRTFYMQLNLEHPPLDDVRVRQALWWALDKDLIVEAVLLGLGSPTDTMLNEHVIGRLDERPYHYDPDRAKELLAEAGVPDGFETSILIYPPYGIPDMAVAMQGMWRDIGVECEIIQREWAQHVELRRAGNFDIGFQPMLRLGPDQYVTPTMHSSNIPYPNASRYASDEMDDLIERARVETNEEERIDLYHQIQRLAHEDVPVIPLLNPVFVLVFQPNIQGVEPGLLTINVTELTVA